ncbi:Vacuolar protein sorting-associated protein 18 like protein, partial [Blomia tropicalis]
MNVLPRLQGTNVGLTEDVQSAKNEGIINMRSNVDEPIFSKNKIDFKPPHSITQMVVSNNQLLIAMNWTSTPHLTDKSKPTVISDIFIDPTGQHCIVSTCLKSDGKSKEFNEDFISRVGHENFYINRMVHKLNKLKGLVISAVGWNHASMSSKNDSIPNTPMGNILIGTTDGRIFETQLQPDDRFLVSKELFLKQICELPDNLSHGNFSSSNLSDKQKEPICAINCFKISTYGKVGLSSITSDSPYLYQIIQNPSNRLHKEMPWDPVFVKLHRHLDGLLNLGILFNDIHQNLSVENSSRLFDEASMIMLNDLITTTTNSTQVGETPISLIHTKFHILLLYPSSLKAICVLNQQVVFEDNFVGTYGRVLGICRDPMRGTVWVYTEHVVYRYKIVQEDRNIWEIYLKKKDFNQARVYAGDDLIKQDQTICEEALHYFSLGDFKASANLFASARSKTFEEIALKFIELKDKDQNALKEYLRCKLQTLSPVKERTQIIILLLWLFEIMLNQLGMLRNKMDDCDLANKEVLNLKVEYNKIESNLKDLISNSNFKACLKKNKKIIYNLIQNHNNQTVLVYFAEHIDDFERMLDYHLQMGEYDQALSILRKEECLSLYYRYSPIIVQERPGQLVTQLIPLAMQADFAKLIPALVHFDNSSNMNEKGRDKRQEQCQEILRFLEYCVFNLQTDNSLVHNYLIALYAQYQPNKLLTYLQLKEPDTLDSSLQTSPIPYDVRYAARLCTQFGFGQATVFLLATMGSVEEAIEQALSDNDIELAKQTAEKVSTVHKPELAKRLWLKIAKYVIKKSGSDEDPQGSFSMKMATNILNECPLLKIEDILPYFPEFSTIDHFKDAICSSLEEYNRNIETLRDDMKIATESAQEIREDIRKLRNRFTVINATDKCSICDYFVMSKPFYSFHCGHLFHSDCLLDEIRQHLTSDTKKKLDELERSIMKSLNASGIGSVIGSNSSSSNLNSSTIDQNNIAEANRREEIYTQIDEIVANECYYCGNYMISTIDKPFIDPEETNALKGWD